MYTYDGKYYNEDEKLLNNLIGLSIESALLYGRSLGYWVRVTSMDNKYSAGGGADAVNNRINLRIVNGKVKSYIVG